MQSDAKRVRSFIAVKLADHLRPAFAELISKLRSSGAKVKWVDPESSHITLRFLGDLPVKFLESLAEDMREDLSDTPSFSLTVEGLGAFPNIQRPRVIWAGCKSGASSIVRLKEDADMSLARLGIEPDGRSFKPHFTLGRIKSPGNLSGLTDRLSRNSDLLLGEMEVQNVEVVESVLTPRGAIHTTLYSLPLKGGRKDETG